MSKKTPAEMPDSPMTETREASITLPAEFKMTDGEVVTIQKFQAQAFVRAGQSAARQKITNLVKLGMFVLAEISTISISGTGNDNRRLSISDFEDFYQHDIDMLISAIGHEIRIDRKEGGVTYGWLPSGASVEFRLPKGKDSIAASEMHGEENRAYSLVSICAKINGETMEMHDVQLMDGVDFMAITNALGSSPK